MNRHFDVCDVIWVVKDFNLAICPNNSNISSLQTPEFTIIGSHTTKWILRIEFKNDKDMVFLLERCDFNIPVKINVNWRLCIKYPVYDDRFIAEYFCVAEHSKCYKGNLMDCRDLIQILSSVAMEVLTFKCTMIIYSDISEEEFQLSIHKGKKVLSENLINMFNQGTLCDLALKIGDRRVMAHKAIMCARIDTFRRLILESREKKDNVASNERNVIDLSLYKCNKMEVVDLSYLEYNAVESLVRYVYSGDLIHVLLKPTLGIYDCVKKLRICKEMIPLEAKVLTLHSTLQIYEISKQWTLKKFCERPSPYTYDEFNIGWHLSLFPSSIHDYFSIYLSTEGETKFPHLMLEISVLNETRDPLIKRILRCSTADFKNNKRVGFSEFIQKGLMESFLNNDNLRLDMRIRLSDGMLQSSVVKCDVPVITNANNMNSFDLLSLHMNELLQTKYFTDVELTFRSVSFILHRCILASRSNYFSCLLEIKHGKYKIDVLNGCDFSTEFYNKLFTYLYSGVLEIENQDQRNDFKRAALLFNIPDLKELSMILG